MKLATLTTTAILAIFAATEARSIEAPRTDMVKRYWTRLRFSAEDYYPKSSLEKKKLKSYTAKIDDWSAEDWAAFILLKCKDADGCASCVAYQENGRKESYWSGFLFTVRSSESDYERTRDITDSIAYSYLLGGASPPSAEDDEERVLDL